MKASLDGVPFLREVIPALTMRARMRGLLGKHGLSKGTGMLIEPCGSVHTFLMKFNLDLIFLDRSDKVVRVCRSVQPGRMVFGGCAARKVIEVEAGSVDLDTVRAGSQVAFQA